MCVCDAQWAEQEERGCTELCNASVVLKSSTYAQQNISWTNGWFKNGFECCGLWSFGEAEEWKVWEAGGEGESRKTEDLLMK